MTNQEAIKFLQQLYPNGGHCWLDAQRIEAIDMAVKALQEETVSYDLVKFADCASVDYRKQRESCGLKDPITLDEVEEANYSGIMAGAQWQKSKLPKWKKFSSNGCWSGEIGAKPTIRKYIYEHYAINADKLFKLLDKED